MSQKSNYLKAAAAQKMWHPAAHPGQLRQTGPRIFTQAQGVHLVDVDGRTVLDAIGGIWNVNLGYSNDAIKDAITGQLQVMPYTSPFAQASDVVIELADRLSDWFAPDGLSHVFFTSGGSDSVETALRMARQYYQCKGEAGRYKFLSLQRGYHGTHFGGASVNGNAVFRKPYEPLLPGCIQLPVPFAYRNMFDEDEPQRLTALCVAAAEEKIAFEGADTIAAFIMEPILGGGGVIVPPKEYTAQMRALCDRHGILLIADEVITAFGRTGHWTGSQIAGVRPDIMCIAKALTNGYFPFGATLFTHEIDAAFANASAETGFFGHGYTYSGHAVGAAAALATLEQTETLDVAGNAAREGDFLLGELQALAQTTPMIGDVRGQGLMLALDLVSDPVSKTPLASEHVAKIGQSIYDAGVLVRLNGNNIILSPPLIITRAHTQTIMEALRAALNGS